MKKKMIALFMAGILAGLSLVGCASEEIKEEIGEEIAEEMPQQMPPQGMNAVVVDLTERATEYSFDEIFSGRDMEQVADTQDAAYITLADETITIAEEGVYVISGSMRDGQIIVECDDKDKVQLVFDHVQIENETLAPIYIKEADKVFITTVADSKNVLTVTGEIMADGETNVDGVIFSKADLTINGEGALHIDAGVNHAIVGKDDVVVTGGDIHLTAEGDGIQANDLVAIAGGTIVLENCEEGLESTVVAIHGGDITIHATDDGINATDMNGKNETEETNAEFGGKGGANMFATDGVSFIGIYAGKVFVQSDGDGIDSNGEFYVCGGEVYVEGAENGGNGAIDFSGSGQITGGVCVATGMSAMAQNLGASSTQCSVLVTFDEVMTDSITVKASDGSVIVTCAPERKYNSVVVSHPAIKVGDTITVEAGSIRKEVEITETIVGGNGGFGGHGGFHGAPGGGRGEFSEGERPQMPEGMELPEGERPQMPEGMEFPEEERPQMPEGMEPPNGDWQGMPEKETKNG